MCLGGVSPVPDTCGYVDVKMNPRSWRPLHYVIFVMKSENWPTMVKSLDKTCSKRCGGHKVTFHRKSANFYLIMFFLNQFCWRRNINSNNICQGHRRKSDLRQMKSLKELEPGRHPRQNFDQEYQNIDKIKQWNGLLYSYMTQGSFLIFWPYKTYPTVFYYTVEEGFNNVLKRSIFIPIIVRSAP